MYRPTPKDLVVPKLELTKYKGEETEKAMFKYIDHDFEEINGTAIPTFAGLARYLGTTAGVLRLWSEKGYGNVKQILEILKDKQHDMLVGNGLTAKYNPVVLRLLLYKHGYSDKGSDPIPDHGDIPAEYSTSESRALAPATFRGVSSDGKRSERDITPPAPAPVSGEVDSYKRTKRAPMGKARKDELPIGNTRRSKGKRSV